LGAAQDFDAFNIGKNNRGEVEFPPRAGGVVHPDAVHEDEGMAGFSAADADGFHLARAAGLGGVDPRYLLRMSPTLRAEERSISSAVITEMAEPARWIGWATRLAVTTMSGRGAVCATAAAGESRTTDKATAHGRRESAFMRPPLRPTRADVWVAMNAGRSSGSRVVTSDPPSRTPSRVITRSQSQWLRDRRSPLTVAGAATA
jgi:hypothetical protein